MKQKPSKRYRLMVFSDEENKYVPLLDGIVSEEAMNKFVHWFTYPVEWIDNDPKKSIGFGIPRDKIKVESYIQF